MIFMRRIIEKVTDLFVTADNKVLEVVIVL